MAKNTEEKTQDIQEEKQLDPMEEKVMIRLPLDRYNKKDVFVGINGRTWQIQRGVNVMVPVAVKEVLETSERMENEALEYEAAAQQELENLVKGVMK